jgi:hypothetical protein
MLGRKQAVELEVAAIAEPVAQIGFDAGFELAAIVCDGHHAIPA